MVKSTAIAQVASQAKLGVKPDRAGRPVQVKIGGDCSGLGSEVAALRSLGVQMAHIFSSEVCLRKQSLHKALLGAAAVTEGAMFTDVKDRSNADSV